MAEATRTKVITTVKEVKTMVYLMCCSCGYLLKLKAEEEQPPQKCPACSQPCTFLNVTSYRPEHGLGNPDAGIMASVLDQVKAFQRTKAAAPRRGGLLESYLTDQLCREAALIAMRELLEQKKKAGTLRVRDTVTS